MSPPRAVRRCAVVPESHQSSDSIVRSSVRGWGVPLLDSAMQAGIDEALPA